MKTPECILNDKWLLECISRFKTQGDSEDALLDFANQWEYAAFRYLCWLEEEGFTKKQALRIIDTALEKANFDLQSFPMCL